MQIQHQLRCQRLLPQLPDALHRQEVVEDHPLGAVPGRPAAADHRLGHIPRGGSALHLRGGDRLLHQRAQQIAIPAGAAGDALGSHRIDTRLHVDLMQPLEQHRRLREPERLVITRQKRQRGGPAAELLRQPPLLMAQTLGWWAMAQLIPMQIAIRLRRGGHHREQRQGLMQSAAALQQLLKRGRPAGQPGGQCYANFKLDSN